MEGLNPLSQIITKSGYGYQFRSGTTVSHLLYMDDIKLYAKRRMISRRGKVVATDEVDLPEGNITDVQDSYKYLGIPQANGNHEEAARRSATAKYLQRLRQILKSQLNGSRWETPPKVLENKQAKILWDFQIQTDKIVVVDKHRKTVVVIDVAIASDSNIRKKEHEKLEKYQVLKEEMERMWGMNATVVPEVKSTELLWTPVTVRRNCMEAYGEGGRQDRERLRLLDLFLWLHHVALQASKGDGWFFSIQSGDR
ncbi:hypothetical protein D4764_14G0004410 [Takifugu flavidus]|uniref:Uncharacterized protein n=1 Tax=Takifugu flavidus TaxID=433684 RepID=A0A5C6P6C9_9TELE|nr:hypothetical protein D4764_14G0004410 [Takifugu flavidus]